MKPLELLATLERSGLVTGEVIDKLRRRIANAPERFDGEGMAKWLVTHGYITPLQAKKLVQQFTSDAKRADAAKPKDPELSLADSNDDPFADDMVVDAVSATKSNITREPAAAADPQDDPFGLAPMDDIVEPIKSAPVSKAKQPDEQSPFATDQSPAPVVPPPKRRGARSAPAWRDDEPQAAPARESERESKPQKESNKSSRRSEDPFADDEASYAGEEGSYEAITPRPADNSPRLEHKSIWESPVLLIGGGVLLLMVILAGALAWSLTSSEANDALKSAEDLYASGAHDNAISKYNDFIKGFPEHKNIGLARVHRAISQLWVTTGGSSDWAETYETARQSLERISKEKEFDQAHKDIGAIAPKIASALVKDAEARNDEKRLALANDALALLDKYSVPLSVQPTAEITQIRASIDSTRRTIERKTALTTAVAKIETAVTAGALPDAYAAQSALTKRYPDLARDEALREAVKKIVAAERAGIKVMSEERPPLPVEGASDSLQVSFAKSPAAASAAAPADIAYALAGGAAYGFDAATGRPLWRRFVGFDGRYYPQPVGKTGGDLIVVDSVAHEVVRLEGATGKPVWRQSFEGALAGPPTVLVDRVLLSSKSGRIDQINIENGRIVRSVQMATPLTCGAAADIKSRVYYQPAAHSTMYVLAADSGECVDVLYMAHAPQSVSVTPLVVNRYVLVAENRGAHDGVLHVLLADENGKNLTAVEQVPLAGHLHTPMILADRILVVATDTGAVYSFEISLPGGERALRPLAQKPADTSPPALRYPAFAAGRLWIASRELTRYGLQAAGGRMNGETVKFTGDAFIQPLQVKRDLLIAARERPGSRTVIVTGLTGADASPRWEAEIATPAAAAPIATPGKVAALTTSGALFVVDPKSAAESIITTSAGKADVAPGGLAGAVTSTTTSGITSLVDPRDAKKVWVIDARTDAPKVLSWDAPDEVTSPPAVMGDGLLVACKAGQVFLLDAVTGKRRAQPYQPRVVAGQPHVWSGACSSGDNALIADAGHLYYLGMSNTPEPALAALATANLAAPLSGAPCATAQTALVVDTQNRLLVFSLPALEVTGSETLPAALAWGPRAWNDRVLLSTQDGRLACHGADGKLLWNVDLASDPLVGAVPLGADHFLVALKSGALVKLSAADGTEAGRKQTGEPIASGPTLADGKLVTVGFDGALSILDSF